jgi:3'-phosphoadenosine 5'-phosphosulfate sulfotransferase (PAPS reductase)/FAD synthetase
MKKMDITELLEKSRGNLNVFDAFAKANDVINNPKYTHIMCSISGGSDSDIMLDLLHKVDVDKKIHYVWFDTGLEYKATKEQLIFLEHKYGIEIKREKALQPIPTTARKVGQPFLSKQVSEMIGRAQKHGFKWEDKSFDELMIEYPNCKTVIMWWCNQWGKDKGEKSRYDIAQNKWLKEFIIANPPTFQIANKCCTYAKKDVAKKYIKENDIDLNIIGVRRAEGGARSGAYNSCFSSSKGIDQYRPLFWFKEEDKRYYEEVFGVTHSDCYTQYGMTRTGCAGCPFNRKFEDERMIIEEYEPKLYKGINNIFKDSYEYTRKYRAFCEEMKKREKGTEQLSLDL